MLLSSVISNSQKLDEVVVTHLQAVHVWVEFMISHEVFLVIEEYFIVTYDNTKPGKRCILVWLCKMSQKSLTPHAQCSAIYYKECHFHY